MAHLHSGTVFHITAHHASQGRGVVHNASRWGGWTELNVRGEEFELAFDWLDWEALRAGHDPVLGALKPLGAVILDAIGEFGEAARKIVRKTGELEFQSANSATDSAIKVSKSSSRMLGLRLILRSTVPLKDFGYERLHSKRCQRTHRE